MRNFMFRNTLFRISMVLVLFLSACSVPQTPPVPPTETPEPSATPIPTQPPTATSVPVPSPRSFFTGEYRNLFKEYLGKSDAEVQEKLEAAFQHFFYGDDTTQRVYYPVGEDMAYIMDIGNNDVRTEGMSYGMMIAVQLDKKEEFDRLWKWTKTYMYQSEGPYRGYFAWHCTPEGKQLAANPASDGEEWFVMALLFAAGRWGNGEGIFNYQAQAQEILDTMLHKNEEDTGLATNMFDPQTYQVVFVPSGRSATFTDPSYHLPAYYELWARWAERDRDFWEKAVQASREFFPKAAHPETGLMPDYSHFDGTPVDDPEHSDFRFDAWRTLSNVAVDYAWFGADPWQVEQSTRVLKFLTREGVNAFANQYTLDGKPLSGDHSAGLVAMAAVAALATDRETGEPFVQALWDLRFPSGKWRYYDGMLTMLGLLHVSGQFRIYPPGNLH